MFPIFQLLCVCSTLLALSPRCLPTKLCIILFFTNVSFCIVQFPLCKKKVYFSPYRKYFVYSNFQLNTFRLYSTCPFLNSFDLEIFELARSRACGVLRDTCNSLSLIARCVYGHSKPNWHRLSDPTYPMPRISYCENFNVAETTWSRYPRSRSASTQISRRCNRYPRRVWDSDFKGRQSFDGTVTTCKNYCEHRTK